MAGGFSGKRYGLSTFLTTGEIDAASRTDRGPLPAGWRVVFRNPEEAASVSATTTSFCASPEHTCYHRTVNGRGERARFAGMTEYFTGLRAVITVI